MGQAPVPELWAWGKHRSLRQTPVPGPGTGVWDKARGRTGGATRVVVRPKQKAPEAPFVVRGGRALDEVVQDALDFALFLRTQGQDLAAVVGDHNGVLKLG